MGVHYGRLRGLMAERGIKQRHIYKQFGMSYQRFSDILNGKGEFRINHMMIFAEILGLDISEFGEYFCQGR